MKKVFTSFAAPLLVLWYLLSVIGFGVHTCTTTGETYIATVASGFTCEDLHPEKHSCPSCKACCERHHSTDMESGVSAGLKSCCIAEYQVITLTGTRVCDDNGSFGQQYGHLVMPMETSASSWDFGLSRFNFFHKPRSLIDPLRDYQASYGIWRI